MKGDLLFPLRITSVSHLERPGRREVVDGRGAAFPLVPRPVTDEMERRRIACTQ